FVTNTVYNKQIDQHLAMAFKKDLKRKSPMTDDYGKLELFDELFNMSALSEEKEKIESELVLAEAKAADVKVPYIDWYKLNEPQMFD
ncbi:unnamed protein product, partial [Brassica oleracea]